VEYERSIGSVKGQFWVLFRLDIEQYGLKSLYEWNGNFERTILDYMDFEEFSKDGLTT
jgi:hypothetical protein